MDCNRVVPGQDRLASNEVESHSTDVKQEEVLESLSSLGYNTESVTDRQADRQTQKGGTHLLMELEALLRKSSVLVLVGRPCESE